MPAFCRFADRASLNPGGAKIRRLVARDGAAR